MSLDRTVAELVGYRMQAGVPLPIPFALAILRGVCDELDRAHNQRDATGQPVWFIHGDVSPPHIRVGPAGAITLSPRATPFGTPNYHAPEYIATGLADARADLFALGVVAHEMLANRPLFGASDYAQTIERVLHLPIPPPSALNPNAPPELDGIVLTALARDPTTRWPSAAMLRDALDALAARLGLEITSPHAWAELLAGRLDFAPTPPPASTPARSDGPPPSDPALWAQEDSDARTRLQPLDPAIEAAALATASAAAEATVLDAAVMEAIAREASADDASEGAIADAQLAIGSTRASTVPDASEARGITVPDDLLAPVAPPSSAAAPAAKRAFDDLPAPVAPRARITPPPRPPAALAVEPPAPAEAEPERPAKPLRAASVFELGPEPTQIGAMPLISLGSGEAPLVSLIGDAPAPRAHRPSLPPASATFLPEPERPKTKPLRIALLVGVGIVVVAAIVGLAILLA